MDDKDREELGKIVDNDIDAFTFADICDWITAKKAEWQREANEIKQVEGRIKELLHIYSPLGGFVIVNDGSRKNKLGIHNRILYLLEFHENEMTDVALIKRLIDHGFTRLNKRLSELNSDKENNEN